MYNRFYDLYTIQSSAAQAKPALSFLHDFAAALAFLRACPPTAAMQQDIHLALTAEVVCAAKYWPRERLHAVAQRLADGRLIIVNRFANRGTFHNFKRPPQPAIQSIPASAPAKPAPKATPAVTNAPEIDESAQVHTLKNAAKEGKPFCEVCEKAKAEARARQA